VEETWSFEAIGGLDLLKELLLKRHEIFTQLAAKYGLPPLASIQRLKASASLFFGRYAGR
jgi:hypothetical protein